MRTVEQVGAERDARPVELTARARDESRGQQARERQRRVEADLVGVEHRTAPATRLPFIGAEEVDAQLLAAAEQVAVGEPEVDTRPEITVGFRGDVDLDGRFERSVEGAVDLNVEPPRPDAVGHRVDLYAVEYAEARQIALRAVHVAHREYLALAEGEAFGYEPFAQARRFHLHHHAPPRHDGVGSASAFVAVDAGGDAAGRVAVEQHARGVRRQIHAHGDASFGDGAVGQIFDEFGLEEIISLVAHGVGDGHAHGAERVGAVAAAGTQIAAAHGH